MTSGDVGPTVEVDVLVIGGGMAGMTAAARAAQQGARVAVLERADSIGGSAILSNGLVWTAGSLDLLLAEDPGIDPILGGQLVERAATALDWLERLGVVLERPLGNLMRAGFGVGARIDIHGFFATAQSLIEDAGGSVRCSATASSLELDDGAVVGAAGAAGDVMFAIRAPRTVIATGGFQANAERRAGAFGEGLVLRSNAYSDGGGARLAAQAGAAIRPSRGFYGHTLPYPSRRQLSSREYVEFAQYHSQHCVVLNRRGERFVDESLGDHIVAQALVQQPGGVGLLVCDQEIVEREILTPFAPGLAAGFDKVAESRRLGANIATENSLPALARRAGEWGYPPDSVSETLLSFNRAMTEPGHALEPARTTFRRGLTFAPFHALEIQAGITFTYEGLRIDPAGYVVDSSSERIPGLLAAGADVGVYERGYGGGLAPAVVQGLQAGESAMLDQ